MSTLNILARQPAPGLGEAGRGRAVLAGSKKKSQIRENSSTPLSAIYFGKKKGDNLSIDGYWPLIYYLKE